jgi:hypothetical protein
MASGKSELKSPASSCARACRAITVTVSKAAQLPIGSEMPTLKCFFYVYRFLGASLEVGNAAFGLTESLRSLGRNLEEELDADRRRIAQELDTTRLLSSMSILLPITTLK